jgi:hypothetical protein
VLRSFATDELTDIVTRRKRRRRRRGYCFVLEIAG